MKVLSLVLSALALVTTLESQARSMLPERPLLQLKTDDVNNVRTSNFRYGAMTVTVTNYGTLEVDSIGGGRKSKTLAPENFSLIKHYVLRLSNAETKTTRLPVVCMAMPNGYRDGLAIARNFRDERSLPGVLRPVWEESGCMYSQTVNFVEESANEQAEQLVLIVRVLALEALN